MPSQTLFGQSHTPRARLDLSPNTHSHKKFWHQNSRSVMQLWAYAAVIQEMFPGTFSSQLFQIFKLDECFWNHFAFDSLCMVCGSAKRLHLLHNWNRLDLEKLRESTIAYCLIWACVTFSPPLPEESPLWKDSSGNWWVQMWKYFTTLLALSKESLCHLLLVIIPGWGIGGGGGFLVKTWCHCAFSQTQHIDCIVLRGWGVNEASLGQTSHSSWIPTTPRRCFTTPPVSLSSAGRNATLLHAHSC